MDHLSKWNVVKNIHSCAHTFDKLTIQTVKWMLVCLAYRITTWNKMRISVLCCGDKATPFIRLLPSSPVCWKVCLFLSSSIIIMMISFSVLPNHCTVGNIFANTDSWTSRIQIIYITIKSKSKYCWYYEPNRTWYVLFNKTLL